MSRLTPLAALSLAVLLPACAARTAPEPAPVPEAEPALVLVEPEISETDTLAVRDTVVSHEDITKQAVGVFGDSSGASVVIEEAAATEDSEAVTWDIDVRSYETHERVAHYVRLFSGDANTRITDRLIRGTRYEPMIRAKFRAAGLPEDMYYLALIESGYDPHATSRALAVGMWQFMTSTAKGVGLRVDWWVDERRDPVRSTDGAIIFLSALQRQFGSLYLAAAAYNGGPGRVSRGLQRLPDEMDGTTRDDLAFELADGNYLPRETRNYVPQLIAAALVGKHPERYGLKVTPLPPFEYDSVRVGPSTPLAAAAKAAGTTVEVMLDLNPHVLRGMTPPKDSFWVRVPVSTAAAFDSAFAALDSAELVAFTRYRTKQGQTFAAVARAHRLTTEQLGWYNQKDRTRRGVLPTGTEILIPTRAVVAAARAVPDPALERYNSSARFHTVRKGETLSHISVRYGVSVRELMRMNRMTKTIIRPGQRLIVGR